MATFLLQLHTHVHTHTHKAACTHAHRHTRTLPKPRLDVFMREFHTPILHIHKVPVCSL